MPVFHMDSTSYLSCSTLEQIPCDCTWEKQQKMAQLLGPLIPMCETRELAAPGVSLVQLGPFDTNVRDQGTRGSWGQPGLAMAIGIIWDMNHR